MKCQLLLPVLLVTILVVGGCGSNPDNQVTAPQSSTQTIPMPQGGFGPGGPHYYYTLAANRDPSSGAFTELEKIDLRTGEGTLVATLGVELFDPDRGVACPIGLCFDQKGNCYTLVDWFFGAMPTSSRLARINMTTGALTWIGDYHEGNMSGPVSDAAGNIYGVGFSNGPNHEPPDWFVGDQILYRFDKATGVRTPVGDTGLRDIMDMAFDARGRLYATTMNALYILSTGNGASQKVLDITGVPSNACEIPLEVMSIDFDANGTLYGTAMEGFAVFCYDNSPVLTIDLETGVATTIGWTGQWYNHGGAIFNPRPPVSRGPKDLE